ncbi:MAG: hypothetical protein AAFX05_05100, partial [Planctomycetota bacterium]
MKRTPRTMAFCLAACTLAACSRDVRVVAADPAATLRDQLTTRLTSRQLSSHTQDALDLVSLSELARQKPLEAVQALRDLAAEEPDGPWQLAAAELLFDLADRKTDASLFLACAREADRAIERAVRSGDGLLDERTEFAADLYRRSVSRFLALSSQPWLADDATEHIVGNGGAFVVRLDAGDGL